jgi:hypothetical protein
MIREPTDDNEALTDLDRDALARCIPIARRIEPIISRAIDTILARDGWEEAAAYACFYCQVMSLGLMPFETPPAQMNLAAGLNLPFNSKNREREGAELLKRMIAAGVSRYEPDPVRACETAEAEAKGVGGCPL